MVYAELVVLEDVLGTQGLVGAIGQLACGVFEAVGVVPTRPAIEVAHVGAQAGFILDRDVFPIWVQCHLPVVGRDVGASSRTVEQITIRLTVRAYA